ncbi:MAG: NTP transferase domain-containing protein [Gammaproteobacteria bacterium]|nr:NTP transferase domain-containing protein [Gammaproteobacteria bacterium]MBI5616671.1 NTP transferase domain-containing protein [Gammaproteobacteria bacterium]
MRVVILCGGKGTRAYPYTEYMPKPMLMVNGTPILMQVIRLYTDQSFREFVLSVGHRKEVIEDYFHRKNMDFSVRCIDTGTEADTGDRIYGCRDVLEDTFMATYADGLSDIDLQDLLRFHRSHDGLATITSVPLISQYGTVEADSDGRIVAFREKPVLREHWINAGFFVFDRAVFDHWEGRNLEREVFPALARKGLLYTYHHTGFFKSMDSYKDQIEIEQLVQGGDIPWKRKAVAV